MMQELRKRDALLERQNDNKLTVEAVADVWLESFNKLFSTQVKEYSSHSVLRIRSKRELEDAAIQELNRILKLYPEIKTSKLSFIEQ